MKNPGISNQKSSSGRSTNRGVDIHKSNHQGSRHYHSNSHPSKDQLHKKALLVAQNYKRCELELITILEQVDCQKVFYSFGYSSIYNYASDYLGLSKDVAAIFINVARKTREVPALHEEIKKGHITVSKARRMTSVLNAQNQAHWLELAKNSSKAQLEKQVALAQPQQAILTKTRYIAQSQEIKDKVVVKNLVKEVRVQLQVGVSEKLMLKLRRVQDVLSQKARKPVSLEQALEVMTEMYLNKEDPLKKAQRHSMRGKLQKDSKEEAGVSSKGEVGANPIEVVPTTSREKTRTASKEKSAVIWREEAGANSKDKVEIASGEKTRVHSKEKVEITSGEKTRFHSREKTNDAKARKSVPGPKLKNKIIQGHKFQRRPLKAKTKHQIYLKYQGQCAHTDSKGKRCSQSRFLEVHHLKPIAKGGTNELANLVLLCQGHHKTWHQNC